MKTRQCSTPYTSGWHESCRDVWCDCSCHGDEPPAGVREPRRPNDPDPVLSAANKEPM